MNAMEQGGETFIWPSQWNDIVQASNGSPTDYDLTAARAAMGLQAGQALFVIYAADAPFWVNHNGEAALPSGNVTNGSGSEFSPATRLLDQTITKISFIAPNASNISLQFYRP